MRDRHLLDFGETMTAVGAYVFATELFGIDNTAGIGVLIFGVGVVVMAVAILRGRR